jgi:hypothetical protein
MYETFETQPEDVPMRARIIATVAVLLLPTLLAAHELELLLPSMASLKARAHESVNVTLGRWTLHAVSFFLHDKDDPQAPQVRQLLKGLTSVQIQTYEFDSDFDCPRAQTGGRWSQMLQVRDPREHDDVNIYVSTQDSDIKGTVIVSCEQRELTIVNIAGKVSADALASLERTLRPLSGATEVGLL